LCLCGEYTAKALPEVLKRIEEIKKKLNEKKETSRKR